MPQVFEVTAPDGRTVTLEGEGVPTEAELTAIFAKLPPKASPAGPLKRGAAGVVESLNPIPMAKILGTEPDNKLEAAMFRGAGAPSGMGNLIRGVVAGQAGEFSKASDAYSQGNYGQAAAYGLAGLVPIAGPIASGIVEKAAGGDVAGAIGNVAGMAVPLKVPRLGRSATAPTLTARAAELAQRGAEKRVVDVMTPKGSSRQIRTAGKQAAKVAPDVLAEPGMTSVSRAGLADKIEAKKQEFSDQYDDVKPANPNEVHDTTVVVEGLKQKIRDLQAETASGPEAHMQVEAMGINTLPERPPASTGVFSDLPVQYKQELRRIRAELEEFQFQEGRKVSREGEVAREGGYGSGRGARNRSAAHGVKDYIGREAGAPVYHEVLQGKTGTTRNAMIKSLGRYIDGTQKSTPIVDRALQLSDKRLRDPDSVARPMLPKDAGFAMSDVEGPLGQNVTPGPTQPRVRVLQQMLQEIQDLGPAATEESLLRIRKSWDEKAKAVYNKALNPDYDVKNAEKLGAADGTDVLRNTLAAINPKRAELNAHFRIWKTADDVMKLAEEINRVKPTVGRQIMARGAGAVAGGGVVGGVAGVLAGGFLGGVVDSMINQGLTTKMLTAKGLERLAAALRKKDDGAALMALRQVAALTNQTRALNLALAQQEKD